MNGFGGSGTEPQPSTSDSDRSGNLQKLANSRAAGSSSSSDDTRPAVLQLNVLCGGTATSRQGLTSQQDFAGELETGELGVERKAPKEEAVGAKAGDSDLIIEVNVGLWIDARGVGRFNDVGRHDVRLVRRGDDARLELHLVDGGELTLTTGFTRWSVVETANMIKFTDDTSSYVLLGTPFDLVALANEMSQFHDPEVRPSWDQAQLDKAESLPNTATENPDEGSSCSGAGRREESLEKQEQPADGVGDSSDTDSSVEEEEEEEEEDSSPPKIAKLDSQAGEDVDEEYGDSDLDEDSCPVCGDVVENRAALLEHLVTEHQDDDDDTTCCLCGDDCEDSYELIHHMADHIY